MTEIERARANLADAEASMAACTNPYAQHNLDSARKRLASLEAAATPATATPPPPPARTPVATAPTPAQPIGTREDRLRRLAAAFNADDVTLEAAIANGTTPDAFALIVSDEALVKEAAREIANS